MTQNSRIFSCNCSSLAAVSRGRYTSLRFLVTQWLAEERRSKSSGAGAEENVPLIDLHAMSHKL
jgi:hypothetical protein